MADDQQFCLRWNNFQANITSQFETLRDDEDFTDVTIACDGQRLQAHKVVLSACSPFFKELFKSNPCTHPIIFMRDVEARDVVALMEFMYAGEVNVAQAHLSAFLKTAESLKIRGLTDTSSSCDDFKEHEEDTLFLNPQPTTSRHITGKHKPLLKTQHISSTSTVTSSQDFSASHQNTSTPPPSKRPCKDPDIQKVRQNKDDFITVNPFAVQSENRGPVDSNLNAIQPKVELPDYLSDDDREDPINDCLRNEEVTELSGGMEIIPQNSSLNIKDPLTETTTTPVIRHRRRNFKYWNPFDHEFNEQPSDASSPEVVSRLMEEREIGDRKNKLVKLGEGIEIYEDQLRSVKWSDYRKLTRGLATILFSPAELATCSVTGQRWSRAGSGERPVKPALDRAKVQAIISYVATRFPMVEISRIKQVLAYKCKENSTAFKMKAVRVYEEQNRDNKN